MISFEDEDGGNSVNPKLDMSLDDIIVQQTTSDGASNAKEPRLPTKRQLSEETEVQGTMVHSTEEVKKHDEHRRRPVMRNKPDPKTPSILHTGIMKSRTPRYASLYGHMEPFMHEPYEVQHTPLPSVGRFPPLPVNLRGRNMLRNHHLIHLPTHEPIHFQDKWCVENPQIAPFMHIPPPPPAMTVSHRRPPPPPPPPPVERPAFRDFTHQSFDPSMEFREWRPIDPRVLVFNRPPLEVYPPGIIPCLQGPVTIPRRPAAKRHRKNLEITTATTGSVNTRRYEPHLSRNASQKSGDNFYMPDKKDTHDFSNEKSPPPKVDDKRGMTKTSKNTKELLLRQDCAGQAHPGSAETKVSWEKPRPEDAWLAGNRPRSCSKTGSYTGKGRTKTPERVSPEHSMCISTSKERDPDENATIIVTNVPHNLTAGEIEEAFEEIGPIERTDVMLTYDGQHTGRVLVTFSHLKDAKVAVAQFDGGDINGNQVRIFLE